jgi:hypothetical protein
MLLTFLLQSYATQTHIHFLREVAAANIVQADNITLDKKVAGQIQGQAQGQKKNNSVPDNPDTCPLCQLLYGGQYVTPSAIVFFLPMAAVSTIEPTLGVLPHYDAVSHNWRGRAPPQA